MLMASDRTVGQLLRRTFGAQLLLVVCCVCAGVATVLMQRNAESPLLSLAAAVFAAFVVATVVAAVFTAVRATRRITAPLDSLMTVVGDLGRGRHDTRADVGQGPAEIRTIATMINSMVEDQARLRAQEQEAASQCAARRALIAGIRRHHAVPDALAAAIVGLRETVRADHVLVRAAPGATGAPVPASWRDEHLDGPLAKLARCSVAWLDCDAVWRNEDPSPDPSAGSASSGGPPEAELRAYAAAGGGPVVTAALGSGGDLFGALTVIRDEGAPVWTVTETRLIEAMADELTVVLHHARLRAREQAMMDRLQEVDRAKNEFMSTVSHELRTPLTSISGYLEMLRDEETGPLGPAQGRMLDVISRNTRRLRALIDDVLILSKIEPGPARGTHRQVDLAALVRQASAAVAPTAAKASVDLHTDIRGPLRVRADPDQLDRVLVHLLSNAIKFTPATGAVTVTGRREGADTIVVVADTGMGIPQEEQAALFARFFRASNAIRQAVPGAGLGLAIVRTILDNHDGHIDVQSQEGAGTAVTVRLPARD